MVDSSSGIGAQPYQQPISQTFQPGKNVDERAEQTRVRQETTDQVGAGEEQTSATAVDFRGEIGDVAQRENNPQAKRGSIINITV